MHHDVYSLRGARILKRQDKQLPDLTGPLSFIIPAEAIRDANDVHIITTDRVNNPGGECKQSQDSYVKLIPVQQAQIAKYALASGNKAAILLRYTKEFQTEMNYKMSSVSMWKPKYVSELKRYVKSSSGDGSRDVVILQNDTSHTASTESVMSHMVPNPHRMPAPSHS